MTVKEKFSPTVPPTAIKSFALMGHYLHPQQLRTKLSDFTGESGHEQLFLRQEQWSVVVIHRNSSSWVPGAWGWNSCTKRRNEVTLVLLRRNFSTNPRTNFVETIENCNVPAAGDKKIALDKQKWICCQWQNGLLLTVRSWGARIASRRKESGCPAGDKDWGSPDSSSPDHP